MTTSLNPLRPEPRRFSSWLPRPAWIFAATIGLSLGMAVGGDAADQKSGKDSTQAAEPDPAFGLLSSVEQAAVAALKKVGAVVLIKAVRPRRARDEKNAEPPFIIVVVGKQWTGSDDDLKHALELSTLEAVYVVGSERVTDKALD